jgi:hypothetical protein
MLYTRRKLIYYFIIGISISFFMLSGYITVKALRIPDSRIFHQPASMELDPEQLYKSENMLRKSVKERASSRISDKDTLSNKNKETQTDDNNTDTKNKLNGTLNTDEPYASQLVYTIQIESQPNVEDAQEQFNYILRSLNKQALKLLRIEKVGKYYTVRLGKFENYDTANKCIQENKSQLPEAIILKANIKNERIVRLHE